MGIYICKQSKQKSHQDENIKIQTENQQQQPIATNDNEAQNIIQLNQQSNQFVNSSNNENVQNQNIVEEASNHQQNEVDQQPQELLAVNIQEEHGNLQINQQLNQSTSQFTNFDDLFKQVYKFYLSLIFDGLEKLENAVQLKKQEIYNHIPITSKLYESNLKITSKINLLRSQHKDLKEQIFQAQIEIDEQEKNSSQIKHEVTTTQNQQLQPISKFHHQYLLNQVLY